MRVLVELQGHGGCAVVNAEGAALARALRASAAERSPSSVPHHKDDPVALNGTRWDLCTAVATVEICWVCQLPYTSAHLQDGQLCVYPSSLSACMHIKTYCYKIKFNVKKLLYVCLRYARGFWTNIIRRVEDKCQDICSRGSPNRHHQAVLIQSHNTNISTSNPRLDRVHSLWLYNNTTVIVLVLTSI